MHTEGKLKDTTIMREVTLIDEKGHIICNLTAFQPESYTPTAKANAKRLALCWNILEELPDGLLEEIAEDGSKLLLMKTETHDKLLDAAQASMLANYQMLKCINAMVKAGNLQPFPAPPLDNIKQEIIDAGGQVFETVEQAQAAIAEAKKEG